MSTASLEARLVAVNAIAALLSGSVTFAAIYLYLDGLVATNESQSARHVLTPAFIAFALITATVMCVSLAAVAWLARRITQPARDLALAMQQVTRDGDYTLRLPVARQDEIGRLTASFNEMLAQIQQRDDALGREMEVRLKIQKRLDHVAYHDALTGLPNREHFHAALIRAVRRTQNGRGAVAVVVIDLDNFKLVNDSLGPALGDTLIKSVATGFRYALRATDLVARLGGDEFGVIVEHAKPVKSAAAVAEKLLEFLATPISVAGHEVQIGASIGIAWAPLHGSDADALMRAADTAMYHAKDSGKGQYRYFAPELNARAAHRLKLESALRHAVARGELHLVYQPQVDVASGRVVAVEALARWAHAERGQLLPGEWISVAEETGMIRAIGAWVLGAACRQGQRWREGGHAALRIAVNVSGVELQDPYFIQGVRQALRESGLPPQSLELEITETVLVGEADAGLEMLTELAAMGIRIAIDDFGIGYSSMSYLGKLPAASLKIDKAFVASLIERREDASIVGAMVALGKSLGLEVIAEGVESDAQMDALAEMRCPVAQGFHIAPPMHADEVPAFVARRLQGEPRRSAARLHAIG
jgi:diguanylate cyclase (GGDEF)-like protein